MHDDIRDLLAKMNLSPNDVPDASQWHTFLGEVDALHQRQKVLYDALSNNRDDMVFVFDLDLNMVVVNEQSAAILQQDSPDVMIGQHANQYLSEEDQAKAEALVTQLLAGEVIEPYQRELILPDGEKRTMLVSLTLIEDQAGAPIYIQSIMRDITAQIQAEVALSERQSNLNTVLAEAPIVLWACDKNGYFTLGVGSGMTALNLEQNAYIGLSVYDIYGDHPQIPHSIQRALAGESLDLIVDVGGLTFDSRYRPLWQDGEVTGVVGVSTNITPLMQTRRALEDAKASAERSRYSVEAILNNSNDGLLVTDTHGNIQQHNPAFETLFGYQEDDLFGEKIPALYDSEQQGSVSKSLLNVIETLQPQRFELQAVRKNGTVFYADTVLSPILQAGKLTGVVCAIRDVSLYKAMEQSLKDARDQAVQASRLKSEFLAMMSHEVRTPLHAIMGVSEMLLDEDLPELQSELVTTIHEQATNLLELLKNILDYSKLEAQKMFLSTHTFKLRQLIEQMTQSVVCELAGKPVQAATTLDASLPELLIGDSQRLQQVLLILLDNAIKFTASGTITLDIRSLRTTDDHVTIQFKVEDTGVGIASEALERIFEPFVQADSSHTRQFGGTGLGLAIAMRIVELMGGQIDVTSAVGEGSCFVVELPLQVAPQQSFDAVR